MWQQRTVGDGAWGARTVGSGRLLRYRHNLVTDGYHPNAQALGSDGYKPMAGEPTDVYLYQFAERETPTTTWSER